MSWPAYPRYKESGVAWLGEVPVGWSILPLRRVIICVKTGNTPSGAEDYHFEEDGFNWYSPSDFSDAVYLKKSNRALSDDGKAEVRKFPPMTVMLVGIGATIGKVGLAQMESSCNQQINSIVCSARLNPIFATYFLKILRDFIVKCGKYTTMPIINQDETKNLVFSVPSIPEQTAIAAFLDRQTAKIDTLLAKKRELIERLKEKRTALISRTVTRGLPPEAARAVGLDPHPAMKPSGIEWLGEVPEHWEVKAIRRVILRLEQGWSPNAGSSPAGEGQWGVLKLSAIREGSFVPSENKELEELPENISPLTPHDGDVIVSRANTPDRVGDVCHVTGDYPQLIIPDLIYRIRLDQAEVLPAYISLFLLSQSGRIQIETDARGSNGSMVKLGQNHVRSWIIPVPPLPEQTAIAAFLNRETAKLDHMVAKVEEAIARLTEYRSALITAAVTGRIDVRATTRQEASR